MLNERYMRVMPRDLFNEANLLKCVGALHIALETCKPLHDKVSFSLDCCRDFRIGQDESTGAISLAELTLRICGKTYRMERPLNSREPWPLWLIECDNEYADPIEVFNDDGTLSDELLSLGRN